MKICLTGDIHHTSLKNPDLNYTELTEVEAANKYADIADNYNIKATLFITGRCLKEESSKVKKLSEKVNVSLGGHNYFAFSSRLLYNLFFNRILGLSNGPAFYQDWEIRKTIQTFEELLGFRPIAWRDHAYRHDKNTFKLLSKNGIKYVSDDVDPDLYKPLYTDGVLSIPINVWPDHDHMKHADVKNDNHNLGRSNFPPKIFTPEKWLDNVVNKIDQLHDKNHIPTLLVHPSCMATDNNFELFEKICRNIQNYTSIFIQEFDKYI